MHCICHERKRKRNETNGWTWGRRGTRDEALIEVVGPTGGSTPRDGQETNCSHYSVGKESFAKSTCKEVKEYGKATKKKVILNQPAHDGTPHEITTPAVNSNASSKPIPYTYIVQQKQENTFLPGI